MSVYKTNTTSDTKSTNLGVQSKDPQSLIDYFSGINGQTFSFNAGEYDAVVGFFEGKDYTRASAQSIAYVILRQARIDNVPVFQVLDTLGTVSPVALSQLVTEILNTNRYKTSVLGYKNPRTTQDHISRNIKA